ncbi:MAG: FAD:protein FMN transferase [Hydrogenobacter thermophilus]|uniref:FAD:protein FMN transferase n=1 Tax=Hydrogenobacter thermophilus TaxID=940 RepID=UPI001C76CB8D|nr:FAD:protein FMN transferase [Hydrogenobacter thermophilus]QWK18994.1 MAG: FAD:protein FMN transferase [Hydrogenobacter thermophilus]
MPIILILLLCSLAFSKEEVFYLMGTYAIIDLPDGKNYQAYRYMRSLEEKLSDYIENSEVSEINKNAGIKPVAVSEETLEVIKKALYISQITDGAFDITVGAITIRARRGKELPENEARMLVDYRKVKIEGNKVFLTQKGMAIDLGGIGKGYAVEKAYQHLKLPEGFISIAGDMKVWGEKRLLAVYDPITRGVLMEGINRKDLCLSTSGNYFRHHIVGEPNSLLQVSVAYSDCTITDALSTAIFAMSDQQRQKFLREHQNVGVLLLYTDGSLYFNKAFLDYFEMVMFRRSERN